MAKQGKKNEIPKFQIAHLTYSCFCRICPQGAILDFNHPERRWGRTSRAGPLKLLRGSDDTRPRDRSSQRMRIQAGDWGHGDLCSTRQTGVHTWKTLMGGHLAPSSTWPARLLRRGHQQNRTFNRKCLLAREQCGIVGIRPQKTSIVSQNWHNQF